jgi:dethiobiotin synthetase
VSGARPELLVVVVGTGTEVGKTWVSAHLLRDLRAEGHTVAARKPAQSFGPEDRTTDAHVLGGATGEDPTDVCPRHRTIADLVLETAWPVISPEVGLVEAAGGVRSPQAADGDAITLIEELQPDVVLLVADAGLGTINGVRLSLEAIDTGSHVATPLVMLNRFDPADDLHRRNRSFLTGLLDVEVLSSMPALVGRLRPS